MLQFQPVDGFDETRFFSRLHLLQNQREISAKSSCKRGGKGMATEEGAGVKILSGRQTQIDDTPQRQRSVACH